MRRRIIIVAIAINVIILTAVVWTWAIFQSKNSEDVEIGDECMALAPPPNPQRFTPGPIFCGVVNRYHGRFSSQIYRASTGEGLSRTSYDYFSVGRAGKELQKKIKGAQQIVASVDDNGKKVGERVVVIFPPNNKGIKRTSIFETNKSSLFSIEAPTLELALEFERKN